MQGEKRLVAGLEMFKILNRLRHIMFPFRLAILSVNV